MYQIYQIKPGETLESIAKNLNINVDELKQINGITNDSYVRVGGYIIIPNNNNSNYKKYVVKKGDNLYSIARQNNVDYKTLMTLNGLKDNEYIYPNQELLIPLSNTYITQRETIKDLLNKLNITVDQIEDLYLEADQVINY